MITPEIISEVENGNLEVLAKLDKNGLFLAPDESIAEFANRLRTLQNKLDNFHRDLREQDYYKIDNIKFLAKNLIPQTDFTIAQKLTQKLYHFQVDWVGGFYQNPAFSWLFGGCCYTATPDFFAVFQIKEKLKETNKKQFYSPDEIIGHELCHVARSGIKNGNKFEEFFAYKTSQKKLRKALGTVLYSPFDTFLILISSFSLPVLQLLKKYIGNVFFFNYLPYFIIFGLIFFYSLRYYQITRIYNLAIKKICPFFGENSAAVLFRCNDEEILKIAKIKSIKLFLEERKLSLRWQIFQKKFTESEKCQND